ncbi:uncharacterized protein LOC143035712 isoform X2 [Oratosquilla oratoria]|uniref:uncharacterized protein LOC143035712 isoform X2 n=1 Tax=Oratosquilla oratoria TaxID=337810 RepID=UPI003F76BBCB
MKNSAQLLREAERLRNRLNGFQNLASNNEAWSVQHQLQGVYGQLLVNWPDAALDQGVELDLWTHGFKNTIAQLQASVKEKQGSGTSEARDQLNWFLNSASGYYLQLFNQICSLYALDLPFRRKDSIYGAVDFENTSKDKSKSLSRKNALYLCQYCLVHLGDLARYRHQTRQAETFYRHAVVVAPTSGQPYNQLALLEAGKTNKLAAVALYVRAMCVPGPFPGAPQNLTQTFSKVLAGTAPAFLGNGESKNLRISGAEYINLFLRFHASLYLNQQVEDAGDLVQPLTSSLSTLVATQALTKANLIHMVVVSLFAIYNIKEHLKKETKDDKKEEESASKGAGVEEDKGCEQEQQQCGGTNVRTEDDRCRKKIVEECLEHLMVGMLASLLLPVYTIRDLDHLLAYYALPSVRLLLEWIRSDPSILKSQAMRKKLQIWPSLCTLVNAFQPRLHAFHANKYAEHPLPEDWDLQGFVPLQSMLEKYKYRDSLIEPCPEEYNLIRAARLIEFANWATQQVVDGSHLMKLKERGQTPDEKGENNFPTYEALLHQTPSSEEVQALERLTLQPQEEVKKGNRKIGILKPQGSLERARENREQEMHNQEQQKQQQQQPLQPQQLQQQSQQEQQQQQSSPGSNSTLSLSEKGEIASGGSGSDGGGERGGGASAGAGGLSRRGRTNVALQAIMKRNTNTVESKQVTFKTPSPAISPNPSEASTDSHRSQLSTPPPSSFMVTRHTQQTNPAPMTNTLYNKNPPPPLNFLGQNMNSNSGGPPSSFTGLRPQASNQYQQEQKIQHQLFVPMQQGLQQQQQYSAPPSPYPNLGQLGPDQVLSPQQLSQEQGLTSPLPGGPQQFMGPPRSPNMNVTMRFLPPPIPQVRLEEPDSSPPGCQVTLMNQGLLPQNHSQARSSPMPGPLLGMVNRPQQNEGINMSNLHRMSHVEGGSKGDNSFVSQSPMPSFQQMQHLPPPPAQVQNKPSQVHPILGPHNSPPGPFLPSYGGLPHPSNYRTNTQQTPGISGKAPSVSVGGSGPAWGGMGGDSGIDTSNLSRPPLTLVQLLHQYGSDDITRNSFGGGSLQSDSSTAVMSGGLGNKAQHTAQIPPASPAAFLNRPSFAPSAPSSSGINEVLFNVQQQQQQQLSHHPLHGTRETGGGENTYSLFSPVNKGSGRDSSFPQPLYANSGANSQSLWSGPGPSPLERLLEQKKQSKGPK